jgi:ribosome recycling factor
VLIDALHGNKSLAVPARASYLTTMALQDILDDMELRMMKSLEVIQDEFSKIRTGKASPSLVENLQVDAYGGHMRLRELASITTPEARLIVIQPWDAQNVDPIDKAIQKSGLGLNPHVDGKIIRLPIPELSEERRKDLDKLVKKMAEDGRVAIRHVRRDAMESTKKEQKAGKITEDDLERAEKEIQAKTDEYIAEIDKQLAKKEKEILTV